MSYVLHFLIYTGPRTDSYETHSDTIPAKGVRKDIWLHGICREIIVGDEIGIRHKIDGKTVVQLAARYSLDFD